MIPFPGPLKAHRLADVFVISVNLELQTNALYITVKAKKKLPGQLKVTNYPDF
jgi:hypothetical protein